MTRDEKEQRIKKRLAMPPVPSMTEDDYIISLINEYFNCHRKAEDIINEIKAHRESYKVK